MALVKAMVKLSNPCRNDLVPLEAESIVSTGAVSLCIPERIANQLRLDVLEHREVIVGDGKRLICPYVGPIQVGYKNRNCYSGALVLGDSVLLGLITLQDMDLIVYPAAQRLSVNPGSPNIPSVIIK